MLSKYRNWIVLLFDVIIIVISYYTALWLRLDLSFGNQAYFQVITSIVPLIVVVNLVVLKLFKVDKTLWKQHSVPEALQTASAMFTGYVIVGILTIFVLNITLPRSVHVISFLIGLLAVEFTRFLYRIMRYYDTMTSKNNPENKRTLIVGAGDAGALLLKEIMNNPRYQNNVIGFLDDATDKVSKRIGGFPILGTISQMKHYIEYYRIESLFIAMPSATSERVSQIIKDSHEYNIEVKILNQSEDLLSEYDVKKNIRPITIADILGRTEIHLDNDEIKRLVQGESVLVTGAAGSIGSELCRQILKYNPKRLVMIDINENGLYQLQNELGFDQKSGKIDSSIELVCLILSICDKHEINKAFREFKPVIIFHAAAHKHVPFMEDTPAEAIKNNIFGTNNLIKSAKEFKVKTFVSISTDKAVNPTNVMGATKRFIEKMIQSMTGHSETKFVAVRFGNVLGSNGSVVPLFTRQIENGGPVTVTHRDMVRYFMTIPEAVSLVLQAATFGHGGELFVLDMGEPVKIYDLATKMIRLAGFEPQRDIKIEITGLRPGEKLFEELLMSEEGLRPTDNELIFVAKPLDVDEAEVQSDLELLKKSLDKETTRSEVIELLKQVVDTYQPEE